jgi:hypothetical protein
VVGVAAPGPGPMSATTVVWGCVADSYGLWRQRHVEADRTADGRFVARQLEEWGADPADAYAASHPAPVAMKWRHGDGIGTVIALRSMNDKLFAVAECELSPAELSGLAAMYGPLRWSPGTSRTRGGPLTLTECSLTPQPASIGLSPVSWHRHRVSKGNPPAWVVADIKRGRHDALRHRARLEVYERTGHWLASEEEAADAHMRHADDRYRHDPRELHYGAAGRILAVGGRPPRG